MEKEMHKQDIIYALADYKQLVLQYKSRYVEQAKRATFWKTTVIWLIFIIFSMGLFMFCWSSDTRKCVTGNKKDIVMLGNKIDTLSRKLDQTQQELASTQEELSKKDIMITQLERNISSASRRLVERLLKE